MTDRNEQVERCEASMLHALNYVLSPKISADVKRSLLREAADFAVIILALRAQAEALA